MTIHQTVTVKAGGVTTSVEFAISGPIGQWLSSSELRDLFDMLMGAGFSMAPVTPPGGKMEVYDWGEILWLTPVGDEWSCKLLLNAEALAHPAVLTAADTLSEP